MSLPRTLPALFLVLAAGACSPADPVDAGYSALVTGRPAEALGHFDQALQGLDESDPRYVETKLGQLRALCHSNPSRASEEFIAFAREHQCPGRDYTMQVGDLQKAAVSQAAGISTEGELSEEDQAELLVAQQTIGYAVNVLVAGGSAHPAEDNWTALIDQLGEKASRLGAKNALAKLEALGYLGEAR